MATLPAASASLVESGGEIIGATGIFYDDGVPGNGDWWDVEFRPGNCIDTLDGCNSVSDFAMKTQANAKGFANALISQVYEAFPAIDTTPDSLRGCNFASECSAIVVWGFLSPGVSIVMALNRAGIGDNGVALLSTSGFGRSIDPTYGGSVYMYIAQGVEPSDVPLPAAAPLLLAGLGGLMALRRKR